MSFPTTPTPQGAHGFAERERDAAVAAVQRVLRPGSVAVLGASRRRGTVGGEVLHNIVADGYTGQLAAVNPKATDIAGVRCFAGIADVPWDVELAVITVPAEAVLPTARACAAKGVRALVVISAGFSEIGADGRRREGELLSICRAAGGAAIELLRTAVFCNNATLSRDHDGAWSRSGDPSESALLLGAAQLGVDVPVCSPGAKHR